MANSSDGFYFHFSPLEAVAVGHELPYVCCYQRASVPSHWVGLDRCKIIQDIDESFYLFVRSQSGVQLISSVMSMASTLVAIST